MIESDIFDNIKNKNLASIKKKNEVTYKTNIILRALKTILILFDRIFGLKLNFQISMLFGVNVAELWLHEATVVMNCNHG